MDTVNSDAAMGAGAAGPLPFSSYTEALMTTIEVCDNGERIALTFEDLVKYHGKTSIGGLALGFKVMERAFPLLSPEQPPERYDIHVYTAFDGPGARDAFEMAARVVTGDRYTVAHHLAPETAPHAPQGQFFFRLSYRGRTVDVTLRHGLVTEEFIQLVRRAARTLDEEQRLVWLKQDLADRLLALPADQAMDASVAASDVAS